VLEHFLSQCALPLLVPLTDMTMAIYSLQAVAESIADINVLAAQANSLEELQKILLVAQTTLLDSVTAAGNGTVSVEEFSAATTPEKLQQSVDDADLPGDLNPEEPTTDSSNDDNVSGGHVCCIPIDKG
jgi:hypothetical protein